MKTRDNIGTIYLKEKTHVSDLENLTYYEGQATVNGVQVSIRAYPRKNIMTGDQFLRLSFRPVNIKSSPLESLEFEL